MAGFPKSERQKIIDAYLTQSGRNLFVAAEFIDWLSEKPEHEAYEWFFGTDDATAAREHRIGLARRMASGLRITAKASAAPEQSSVVQIAVREYPAYVSPMAGRKHGGGYQRFDPEDGAAMAELQRQGGTALRSWLARYRGAFEGTDIDVSEIEKIAALIEGRVALSA